MRHLWVQFGRFLHWRKQLVAGIACGAIAAWLDIEITRHIGSALNALQGGGTGDFLPRFFVWLMLIALVRGLVNFLRRWWIVVVSRYVENDLKQSLFDKLAELSPAFHNQNRSGDLVSRSTSDVENVRMFLGPGLMYSLDAFVRLPLSLMTLGALDPTVTLWMLLPLAALGIGMAALSPRLQRVSQLVQESLSEIGQRAQENFAGIRVVKGYGREEEQVRRFDSASRANLGHQLELGRARGITHAITWGSRDLTFLPILVFGGLGLIDRSLLAGDLFQFVDLTFKLFWPIVAVGWMAGIYPRAKVSAQRIQELLDRPSDIREPAAPRTPALIRGELTFRDVSFTYPLASAPTLVNLTFEVPAGSVVGIVGPTGTGKTTLLNLIARLYDAQGELKLDGVPLRDLPLATLRGALGYVPQDSFLFSASWRENLSFGIERTLGDPELARLAERTAMTSEVARFPEGFDQRIGERGVTLSGGQRQRSCIARALAKDPRILVLDDALSAVDSETESLLLHNLRAAREGRTVILAAHRLSTVRHADRIVVLVDGRIQDIGTHAELVRRPGWYASTWTRQETQEELAEL